MSTEMKFSILKEMDVSNSLLLNDCYSKQNHYSSLCENELKNKYTFEEAIEIPVWSEKLFH